jgi:hypothetical protein
MRYVKLLSTMLGMALIATVASAKECDSFGKGALGVGATPPPGISTGSGYVYGRHYVQPAPVIATAPATTGRRAFSVEPAAAAAAAPATAAPAKAAEERTRYRRLAQEQLNALPRDRNYGATESSEPRVISGTAQ